MNTINLLWLIIPIWLFLPNSMALGFTGFLLAYLLNTPGTINIDDNGTVTINTKQQKPVLSTWEDTNSTTKWR